MYIDTFEARPSLIQNLTFEFAKGYLEARGVDLDADTMRTLGIVAASNAYTNLALLISDQCPSFIKAAVFDDDDRNVFLEREEYSGSLLSQLEDAYSFLENHNHFKTRYEGLQRIDYKDYPQEALREALINALAHREYALSGPTLINVMPSGTSIVSLGGLPLGITFDDLSANISIPRNKLLASLLYRIGNIEAWGTGIGRMRSAYKQLADAVKISVTPNTFTVELTNRNAPSAEIKGDSLEQGVMDAISAGCSTRAQIQEQLNLSQTRTINLLAAMVNQGLIVREGGSRNIRYRLSD